MSEDTPKMPVTAPGAQAPRGALVRLASAATKLGLSDAEVLELAEEGDNGTLIRVCIMVPDDAVVWPYHEPHAPPPGHIPADLRYAIIFATNTPGFFRELAERGAARLEDERLELFDGSGMVWTRGLEVSRDSLMVVREDVNALMRSRDGETTSGQSHEMTAAPAADAWSKRARNGWELAQSDPTLRKKRSNEINWSAVARRLGFTNPKHAAAELKKYAPKA